jgi:hypothetical protein
MGTTLKIMKLIDKFYKKLVKHKLLSKKREDLAIFEILSAYITEAVLSGNEGRREELAEMQKKITEFQKFIEFLKKI